MAVFVLSEATSDFIKHNNNKILTASRHFDHKLNRERVLILIKSELYSNEAENKQGNEEIWDAMTTLCENLIYEVLEVVIYDVRTLSNKLQD